jgi:hypothetical protein
MGAIEAPEQLSSGTVRKAILLLCVSEMAQNTEMRASNSLLHEGSVQVDE